MLQSLRDKTIRYWFLSVLILIATIWAKPLIDSRLNLADARDYLFQVLTTSRTNPSRPRHVKLILIGDDEFWDGDLHHRSPTDRNYLARLIRAADVADASAIAIDFDLRLPDAREAVATGDYAAVDRYAPYRDETDTLMRTVADVAQRRPIVLAKTMRGPLDGPFKLLADAYQPYGICTRLRADGVWANPGTPAFPLTPAARARINCGYIALMSDRRRVPPAAEIAGSAYRLDSLPMAVVRTRDPAAASEFGAGEYYASYVPPATLANPRVTVSAHRLLADPVGARAVLQGWPVIIGAAWHLAARGAGRMVDLNDTPIGLVNGAVIHENLADAVLSNRIYPSLSERGILVIELFLGGLSILLFALAASWGIAVLLLAGSVVGVLLMQWVSLQMFGTFIDMFAPVVGLGVHAILDRILNVHH